MRKRIYAQLDRSPFKSKFPSVIRHRIDDKRAGEMVKDVSATVLVLLKVAKEASVPLPALQAVVGGLLEVVKVYQVDIH